MRQEFVRTPACASVCREALCGRYIVTPQDVIDNHSTDLMPGDELAVRESTYCERMMGTDARYCFVSVGHGANQHLKLIRGSRLTPYMVPAAIVVERYRNFIQ